MTEPDKKLESWKEIAAYLQRDVRTVIRWEKTEGLPVRRHRHLTRSSVYAYPNQLDAWRQARQPAAEQVDRRPLWRRPLPSLAFSLVLLLSLMLAGDAGPGVIKARAQSPEAALTARRLWAEPGVDISGGASSDGRHLAYVDWDTGNLALRDLAAGQNRQITTEGTWDVPGGRYAYESTVSPDGRQVAYQWFTGADVQGVHSELRLLAIDGGQPRTLYRNEQLSYIQPTAWSADGKSILALLERRLDKTWQLALVSAADGSVRALKSLEWRRPAIARLSPDGRYAAYDAPNTVGGTERDIFVLATDGSSEVALVKHPASDWGPTWTPDGRRVVFVSNRSGSAALWAIEVADGKPRGAAELLKADIGDPWPVGFSQKGSFYYGVRGRGTDIFVAELDAVTGGVVGAPKQIIETYVGRNSRPTWSLDGKSIAYLSNRDPGARSAPRLVIRSVETGEERTLPWHPGQTPPRQYGFAWSPDGRYLATGSFDDRRRSGIFRIDSRTGETVPIVETGEENAYNPVWSPDGKAVFYVRPRRDEKAWYGTVARRQVETGQETELARVKFRIRNLAVSPDGRQLAFTGGFAVSFVPTGGGERREVAVANKDQDAIRPAGLQWTPGGRHVLFVMNDIAGNQPFELHRLAVDGDRPQKLGLAMSQMWDLSISPDGRRLAFTAPRPGAANHHEVWVLENLLAPLRLDR